MEEGKIFKPDLKTEKWVGLLLAGVLLVGLGVFSWITARHSEPKVEIISEAEEEENGEKSRIVVDISGAVNEPGVYTFNANTRVDEAIRTAGGINSEADEEWLEKNINRADKLTDGMKIYIPKKKRGEEGSSQTDTVTAGDICVSLNEASQSELESLPGVGPVTAEKITAGRPYGKIGDLKEKQIVGEKLFGQIEAKVCVW